MGAVGQAAVLVTFPVVSAVAGSVLAVVRRPSPRVLSAVQHGAAGVVIAALAGEILPDLKDEGHRVWAATGFGLGVVCMLALAEYARRSDARRVAAVRPGAAALPIGLLVAVGVDLLLDGALVGLGSTLGTAQGIVLTVALTLEVMFLGLSVVGELTELGHSPRRSALIAGGSSLLMAVGAIGAAAGLSGTSPSVIAAVLAFGAAALLYLAVEELLVEAHEGPETPALTAMFFLGFLSVYALTQLGG